MSNGFTWYGVNGEEFIDTCINGTLKENLEKHLKRRLPTHLLKEDIPALECAKSCLSQSLDKDESMASMDELINHIRKCGSSYIERSW